MAEWSLYQQTRLGDECRPRDGASVRCREIRRYRSKRAAVHAASKHVKSDRIFAAKTWWPPLGRRPRTQ
ncbi:MAG: hypothetical protein ACREMO_08625 [Gemmatimonadales bacterium]